MHSLMMLRSGRAAFELSTADAALTWRSSGIDAVLVLRS